MAKPKTLTLELTDKKPSGWVLEEAAKQGIAGELAERIDSPSQYFLPIRSVVREKDASGGFRYRDIRHIEGCDTIYVDEQDKRGVKPNPDRDSIVFLNGALLVADDGLDKSRYAYLQACEYNGNNSDRPDTAVPKFRVIEKEKEAERTLIDLDEKMEAFTLLSSLVTKMETGFSYNEEKINYMCALFGIHADSPAEKMQQLQWRVEANPSDFIKSVLSARETVKVDIAHAEKFSVISMAGEHASFMQDGGKNIYKFRSKSKTDRFDELVEYFLSPKGDTDYKQMCIQLERAKDKAIEMA